MSNLRAFRAAELAELMTWFPDAASCRTWGGPAFRYPFTGQSFREDSKVDQLASWSLVDADDRFCAFGQHYLRAGRCHLGRLAVAPALRNRGIGRELVHEIGRRGLEEFGVDSCSLFVLPGNDRAQRLYCRLGFEVQDYPEPAAAFEGCTYMVAPAAIFGKCAMQTGHLLRDAAAPGDGERFEQILALRDLVIERIVSSATATPAEYLQPQDEWVLLVHGEATLRVAGEPVTLKSGDYLFLPALVPHTVERVSEGAVWLAVHLHPAQSSRDEVPAVQSHE